MSAASLVGAEIEVTTVFDRRFQGLLFALSQTEAKGTLVLEVPVKNSGNSRFVWILTSQIAGIKLLNEPTPQREASLVPHALDLNAVDRNACAAGERARENLRHHGVGVSLRAQNVYDKIQQTMGTTSDVCWSRQFDAILVEEGAVRVVEPWGVDNIEAASGASQELVDQVGKRVESVETKA